jgi:hypothetical protein
MQSLIKPLNSFEVSERTTQAILLEAARRLKSEEEAVNLWTPLPGPQTGAYHSQAGEVFYGGSAGGGKTDLLLGLALTAHRKSVIFRREYPQLKDVVMRSQEVLVHTSANFNGQTMMWKAIPGGRTLEFGAVQYETDVQKYQGRAHDLKAFDEVSAFTESQYRFLIGWARTTEKNQRVRVVCAGNPPTTAEGEWVIARWGAWLDAQHPNPAEPGELRWYAVVDGDEVEREDGTPFDWQGETIQPKSRTFIPARLSDNPYLAETGYAAVLQNMPEPLRSQLLYGDFSIGTQDDEWQVIPTEWIRQAQGRWEASPKPDVPLTVISVDVARGGDDQTIIAKRYGTWYAPLIKHPGQSTPDGRHVADLVMGELSDEATVNIDVIGVGVSPYDTLKANGVRVRGINVAKGSKGRDRTKQFYFANVRAQLWWKMREALEPEKGEDLALPPDKELLGDLCAPRYKVTPRGIQIQSKDEIRKRLGRSTDCGDAVVLALYHRVKQYVRFL